MTFELPQMEGITIDPAGKGYKVDSEPFIQSQENLLVEELVRPEDLSPEDVEKGTVEKLKKSLPIQLKEMIDYLSTTEEDSESAREFYSNLYANVFDEIEKSNSIADFAGAFEKIKFQDINARYHETIRGGWRTLGSPKMRGIEGMSPTQAEPVKRIISDISDKLRAFHTVTSTLRNSPQE